MVTLDRFYQSDFCLSGETDSWHFLFCLLPGILTLKHFHQWLPTGAWVSPAWLKDRARKILPLSSILGSFIFCLNPTYTDVRTKYLDQICQFLIHISELHFYDTFAKFMNFHLFWGHFIHTLMDSSLFSLFFSSLFCHYWHSWAEKNDIN